MTFNFMSRRGLAAVSTACLISVALPAVPAWAQKTKDKHTSAPATQESSIDDVSVSIPTVDAVNSSIDGDTIKSILSGDIEANAEALSTLNADSITVPEISINITSTVDGESQDAVLTFTDLVLEDVVDGVAASASLGGTGMTLPEGGAEWGAASVSDFNIRGILGIYGLVDAGQSEEMQTLYSDFKMDGGTFEAPEMTCEIGPFEGGGVRGRPLKTSIIEFVHLAQKMEADPEMTDPALFGQFVSMYADFLTAFESDPVSFEGFACDGQDDKGQPMTFNVGNVTMAGMTPGIYPQISMDGFDVTVEGDGAVSVDNVTIKQFDMSSTIEALANVPADVNEAWFDANARSLIPSFEGFSFAGLSVDIPDSEADGERVVFDIDNFDLTLGNYVNGIPGMIDTSASGIKAALPDESGDPQLQQLIALGIKDIDAGFRFAAAWDEATDTIDVSEISVTGKDLANIVLTGTLANATEALFSLDENEAIAAGMGIAVKALNLDVTDSGLSDIILAVVGAEQGTDPATMRPVFAGLAEGTIVGMMAGAADAAKLGTAVNQFISGKAKSLNIAIEAKEDPGLGMADFMAAEQDPTVLIDKVNITAAAK